MKFKLIIDLIKKIRAIKEINRSDRNGPEIIAGGTKKVRNIPILKNISFNLCLEFVFVLVTCIFSNMLNSL